MRRGLTWYRREPLAFLDGVQGLGPDLIGAYAVLLDLIYARDGETLRDDRHLAGILGCGVRKARALTDDLIARGKLRQDGNRITNPGASRRIKRAQEFSESRSKAGRNGGVKSGETRRARGAPEGSSGKKLAEKSPQSLGNDRETTVKQSRSQPETGGSGSLFNELPEANAKQAAKQIREEKIRVPSPSGDGRESASDHPLEDPSKVIFRQGLRLLTDAGVTEQSARGCLGRWRKQHGEGALIDALGRAYREAPSDPIPWITACLNRSGGRTSNDRVSTLASAAAALATGIDTGELDAELGIRRDGEEDSGGREPPALRVLPPR